MRGQRVQVRQQLVQPGQLALLRRAEGAPDGALALSAGLAAAQRMAAHAPACSHMQVLWMCAEWATCSIAVSYPRHPLSPLGQAEDGLGSLRPCRRPACGCACACNGFGSISRPRAQAHHMQCTLSTQRLWCFPCYVHGSAHACSYFHVQALRLLNRGRGCATLCAQLRHILQRQATSQMRSTSLHWPMRLPTPGAASEYRYMVERPPEQPAELAEAQHKLAVDQRHAGLGRDLRAAAPAGRRAAVADHAPIHCLARAQHFPHQLRLAHLQGCAAKGQGVVVSIPPTSVLSAPVRPYRVACTKSALQDR